MLAGADFLSCFLPCSSLLRWSVSDIPSGTATRVGTAPTGARSANTTLPRPIPRRPKSWADPPFTGLWRGWESSWNIIDGNSLDLSALVDYQADLWRGDDPDPNIYENSRMTKRDLSVLILLDCSGSTAENSSGHTVFEEERRLAADLT